MRTLPRLVLCVLGIVGLLGTGYAWIVSSPTGASPDDDYHQTSIWCPMPIEDHCPVVGTDEDGDPVVNVPQPVDVSSLAYAFAKDTSASYLTGLSDDALHPTNRVNTGNYPGYYYSVMHLFIEHDVDRAILVMRWVNFGIAVIAFGAALLLLPAPRQRLLTYTLLCAALPMNLYFTASINPSTWAFTGIVALWIGLEGFFTSQGWRRAGLAGVALVGALLAAAARTDSATYCAIIALAISLFHFREAWKKKRLFILPVLTGLIGVTSFLLTSTASSLTSTATISDPTRSQLRVLISNIYHMPRVLYLFWRTDLGWFDVPTPTITAILLILVTLVMVGYCLIRVRWDRYKIIALIIVAGAFYGLPVLLMQMQHMYLAEWGIQVRYIAPLMIVFFGILMTGSDTETPRIPWYLWVPCLVAIVVAHSLLLHTLIRRYVTGMDVTGFDLDIGAEWWRSAGPSPLMTWAMGSVGLACFLFSCLASRAQREPGLVEQSQP